GWQTKGKLGTDGYNGIDAATGQDTAFLKMIKGCFCLLVWMFRPEL
ncbi:MAG: hypothetical protein JWR23_1620, partial [Mucilaginibacter sp.]|nr:hypothetical protein [Mucilaginibacter sp.]